MKYYLNKEQKEKMYYDLKMFYNYKKALIDGSMYICECDMPENYEGDINVYPYQIIYERTDDSIKFITKEYFKELRSIAK